MTLFWRENGRADREEKWETFESSQMMHRQSFEILPDARFENKSTERVFLPTTKDRARKLPGISQNPTDDRFILQINYQFADIWQ